MNRFLVIACLLATCGCASYSSLKTDVGSVRVDGRTPAAVYEVVNVSYAILGIIPLTTGVTWQEGPYVDGDWHMTFFRDRCTLDENLASVRHACKIVGSDDVRNISSQVDTCWFWSLLTVRKRIATTSCVIMKK